MLQHIRKDNYFINSRSLSIRKLYGFLISFLENIILYIIIRFGFLCNKKVKKFKIYKYLYSYFWHVLKT